MLWVFQGLGKLTRRIKTNFEFVFLFFGSVRARDASDPYQVDFIVMQSLHVMECAIQEIRDTTSCAVQFRDNMISISLTDFQIANLIQILPAMISTNL